MADETRGAAKRYLWTAEFFLAVFMVLICLFDVAVYARHLWWSGWSPGRWPGWAYLPFAAFWFSSARYLWRNLGR